MMMDYETEFSDNQAITVSAPSDHVIKSVEGRLGEGEPVEVFAEIGEDFAAVGAATLVVGIETDDNEGFASPTTVYQTGAISKDTLKAGYKIPLPPLPDNLEEFVRLYFTVATGPMTAGKIDAGLVLDKTNNIHGFANQYGQL